jgi:hypothetical protein
MTCSYFSDSGSTRWVFVKLIVTNNYSSFPAISWQPNIARKSEKIKHIQTFDHKLKSTGLWRAEQSRARATDYRVDTELIYRSRLGQLDKEGSSIRFQPLDYFNRWARIGNLLNGSDHARLTSCGWYALKKHGGWKRSCHLHASTCGTE